MSNNRYATENVHKEFAVPLVRTLGLFVLAACLEIAGCYLAYLWIKKAGPPWLPFLSLAACRRENFSSRSTPFLTQNLIVSVINWS
ncbi:MAG: YnfA family protein [Aggregatilineales bacterium]